MTFLITTVQVKTGTVLCIEGELTYEGIGEIRKAIEGIKKPFAIDLSDLRSADKPVVMAFRQWVREGVNLKGASPYLSLQLADQNNPSTITEN